MKVRKEFSPNVVLRTHRAMAQRLSEMTEEELLAALKVEASRPDKRRGMINRLHRRFNELRNWRERAEYMK